MAKTPKKHASPSRQTCASWIPYARTKSCGPLAGPACAGQKCVRLTVAQRRLKISAIPFIHSPSTSGLKFFSAGRPICPMPASRAERRLSGKPFLLLLLPDKRRKKFTKALNHNIPYPNKQSPQRHTIIFYYTKSCTVITNL